MAYEIKGKKTEHAGAKKGKGAYYGRKKDAKKASNKERRRAIDFWHMKAEIMRVLDDEDDFDVMLGVADHLFGEGWEDA